MQTKQNIQKEIRALDDQIEYEEIMIKALQQNLEKHQKSYNASFLKKKELQAKAFKKVIHLGDIVHWNEYTYVICHTPYNKGNVAAIRIEDGFTSWNDFLNPAGDKANYTFSSCQDFSKVYAYEDVEFDFSIPE